MNLGLEGKKSTQLRVSDHTRKVRVMETTAKAVLWVAAGITIGILLIIIGYILYKGFIYNRHIEYNVITKGSRVIHTEGQSDEDIVIILNKGIRTNELTMETVIDMFKGDRRNWGKISEQDLDVKVFVPKNQSGIRESFERIIMDQEPEYARNTQFMDSDEDIVRSVAATPGAIGYISASRMSELEGKGVKVPAIRRISIIVSKDVLEVKENTRLRFLNENHIKRVFSGNVKNWSEVGGIDLPIQVVSLPRDTEIYKEFRDLALGQDIDITSNAIYVNSAQELIKKLDENPGSVAFCYYSDAMKIKDQVVKVERHEIKPNLTFSFIVEEPKMSGQVGGISTIILNTLYMVVLTILFSAPIGIAAAIYLTEYAVQGKLIKILRFGTETLAGIPSVIFGLFGFIFFVSYMKLGIGLLSGTLTLTIMILPTIIRTSEEAIKSVPISYREGSLALGATKWQTIRRVVVPAATPGILTGIILAIGRAVGETAALLFTMGTDYRLADGLSSSARSLSVHLYILAKEGISFEKAFATGTILIIVILIVNYATNRLIGRMNRMQG